MDFNRQGMSCLLFIAILLCGCKSSSSSGEVTPVENDEPVNTVLPLPNDAEILAMLDDASYRVPDGFFIDERASTPRSYTVYHVKDESVSYELCTDDYQTAFSWEEADNAARYVSGPLVDYYENERYFEFVRELDYTDSVSNIDEVSSPGFARVFKCSYASRDGVDRSLLTGYAGKLNARPLDDEVLRVFVEYLWQFAYFNVSRRIVLDSLGSGNSTSLQRTLLLAFETTQSFGNCSLIELVEWRFEASRLSGEVQSTFETVRSFSDGTCEEAQG